MSRITDCLQILCINITMKKVWKCAILSKQTTAAARKHCRWHFCWPWQVATYMWRKTVDNSYQKNISKHSYIICWRKRKTVAKFNFPSQKKNKKKLLPGDSKWPFHPLVGGHSTPYKGHLTIPKRSLWITRCENFPPPKKFPRRLRRIIALADRRSLASRTCFRRKAMDSWNQTSSPSPNGWFP